MRLCCFRCGCGQIKLTATTKVIVVVVVMMVAVTIAIRIGVSVVAVIASHIRTGGVVIVGIRAVGVWILSVCGISSRIVARIAIQIRILSDGRIILITDATDQTTEQAGTSVIGIAAVRTAVGITIAITVASDTTEQIADCIC